MSKNRLVRFGFLILSIIVLSAASYLSLQKKEALFLDEYYSFGCANGVTHGKAMPFLNNHTYSQEELNLLVLDTYAVNPDERFRFDVVWRNMDSNVHPPVFYALLHFVCSWTPGVYAFWQPYIVNLFFAVISLIFVQKFVKSLTQSELLAGMICLIWSGTFGLTAAVVFMRDYMAALCSCLIAAWECFRYLKGNRRIPDLIKIAVSSALAVLCHFYCAIYLFFLCAVLCVILMCHKNWKSVFQIIVSEIGAALLAIAVFPSMISRMFTSGRGVEATENLLDTDMSSYGVSLEYYLRNAQSYLFGNKLIYILLLIVLLFLVSRFLLKKAGGSNRTPSDTLGQRLEVVLLLTIPSFCYLLLISKIAPFQTPRYLYPVYAVIFLSVFAALYYAAKDLGRDRLVAAGLSVVMLGSSVYSWRTGRLSNMYQGLHENFEERLEPHRGIDAVQIWSKYDSMMCVTIPEYEYFSTVTFFNKSSDEDILAFPAFSEGKELMLLLEKGNSEPSLRLILDAYPEYEALSLGNVDQQGRFVNYYLQKKETGNT